MMKALILAGGHGTRLRPTTLAVNKHLLPVAGKPMILYGIEALRDAGIDHIIVSIDHSNPDGFMKLLRDGDDYGVPISYVYQHGVEGIAWAINKAQPWLGEEPFVVYLGDNIFERGIKPYIEEFSKNTSKPLVLLKEVQNIEEAKRYGVALLDPPKLVGFIEKPQNPTSRYIVLGLYCLTSKFFDIFPRLKPSDRGEYEIMNALNGLLPVNYKVYDGAWWDCGTYEDIHDASEKIW